MSSETKGKVILVILVIITIIYIIICGIQLSYGQKVTKRGDVFIQDTINRCKKQPVTLTRYQFRTAEGVEYPIYKSSTGKCFIVRKTKKGKTYKQYLPEITKLLKDEK